MTRKTMRRHKPFRFRLVRVETLARLYRSLRSFERKGDWTPIELMETRASVQHEFRRKA